MIMFALQTVKQTAKQRSRKVKMLSGRFVTLLEHMDFSVWHWRQVVISTDLHTYRHTCMWWHDRQILRISAFVPPFAQHFITLSVPLCITVFFLSSFKYFRISWNWKWKKRKQSKYYKYFVWVCLPSNSKKCAYWWNRKKETTQNAVKETPCI